MASAQGTKDCEKIKVHDQGEERFPEPDTKCIDKDTEVQDGEKIAPETGEKKHENEREKKKEKKQKDKETAERDCELKEGAQEEEAEEGKKDKKEKKEKKEKGESKDEKKKEREGVEEMEEEEEKGKKEKKEKKEKCGSKEEKKKEKKKEKKEKDPAQYSAEKLKQKLEKIEAKLQKMFLQKEEYTNLLKQAEQRHIEEEKAEPCEGPNEAVKIKEKGLENLPDEIDSLSISSTKVEVTITDVSKEGMPTVSHLCSKVEETTVRPVGN